MEKVGLARGDQSYDAVKGALELISDDINIPPDLPVVIKTNMVMPTVQLAATPVEAVQATMDYMMKKGVKKFVVAEGTSAGADTLEVFERFGYFSLKGKYDVEFRDLNKDEYVECEVLGENLEPVTVRLAKSFLNCYLVSVTRMKTHRRTGITLTLKNLAVGFILDPDRHPHRGGLLSHDIKDLHLSITRLAHVIVPQLAVVDGAIGAQGNSPVAGTPIASGMAVAGTNALAVDLVGTRLMGFDPRTVGHLWYLSQLKNLDFAQIQVLGEDMSQCITRYEAPDNYAEVLGWWVENWREYVEGNYPDFVP